MGRRNMIVLRIFELKNVKSLRSNSLAAGRKVFDGKNLKEYKEVQLKSVLTINRKSLAAMTSLVFAVLQASFGKYDVVHFHAEGSCAMLWLAKLFGKRCIATVHDA